MTRFMFSLVGTSQTPILELPVYSAAQLNAAMRASIVNNMGFAVGTAHQDHRLAA